MVIKSIWRKIGKIFFDFSVNLGHTGVHKDKLLIKLLENHMVTTRPGWVWIRGFFSELIPLDIMTENQTSAGYRVD